LNRRVLEGAGFVCTRELREICVYMCTRSVLVGRWRVRQAREDEDRAAVAPDDAQGLVAVERVDVGDSVPAQRPGEGVLHAPVGLHGVQLGPHEHLDRQQLGLLAEAVNGGMELELVLPALHVLRTAVGLDPAAGDPDAEPVRRVGIGERVAVGGHDPSDGPVDVAVGGVGELLRRRLDRKGGDDAAVRAHEKERVRYAPVK
jgi:hypothetical protein